MFSVMCSLPQKGIFNLTPEVWISDSNRAREEPEPGQTAGSQKSFRRKEIPLSGYSRCSRHTQKSLRGNVRFDFAACKKLEIQVSSRQSDARWVLLPIAKRC